MAVPGAPQMRCATCPAHKVKRGRAGFHIKQNISPFVTIQNIQADKGGQQIAADLPAVFVNHTDTIAISVKANAAICICGLHLVSQKFQG